VIFKKKFKSSVSVVNSLRSVSKSAVVPIQGTDLTVDTEIFSSSMRNSQFGARESKFHITVTNTGEATTHNLSLEANTPSGAALIDPGALFGNSRRFVRMPPLAAQKKITYKLGIRVSDNFDSGELIIRLSTVSVGSAKEFHDISIPLRATASN
jgi:hypothetical protein